nr:MAG TPA: Protein of unknown function (DUF2374) [Caudoviricetes sp.]
MLPGSAKPPPPCLGLQDTIWHVLGSSWTPAVQSRPGMI